jgi:hypothetical protein
LPWVQRWLSSSLTRQVWGAAVSSCYIVRRIGET